MQIQNAEVKIRSKADAELRLFVEELLYQQQQRQGRISDIDRDLLQIALDESCKREYGAI